MIYILAGVLLMIVLAFVPVLISANGNLKVAFWEWLITVSAVAVMFSVICGFVLATALIVYGLTTLLPKPTQQPPQPKPAVSQAEEYP